MRLPLEIQSLHYDQEMQYLLAGHEPEDSVLTGDPPRTLSNCARVNKLLTIVGDLPRILHHLGIEIEAWRDTESAMSGPPFKEPRTAAKYDFIYNRLDVSEEAARIAGEPLPSTRHLLRRGARAVVRGPEGQLWLLGNALQEGRAVLRALDFVSLAVVWDGPIELFAWDALPAPQSFRVFGQRLFIAHEKRLIAVNLADGRHMWTAELPIAATEPLARNPFPRAPKITHVSLSDQRSVVAIELVSHTGTDPFLAFDGETGALLWQIDVPAVQTKIHEVPGLGFAIHGSQRQSWAMVLEALSGAVLCSFGVRDKQGRGEVEWMHVLGTAVLLRMKADPTAHQPSPCLLAIDPRTGHHFEIVPRTLTAASDTLIELNDRPLWLRWTAEYKGLSWMEPFADQRSRPHGERFERWVDLAVQLRFNDGRAKTFQAAIVADGAIVIAYAEPSKNSDSRPTTTLLGVDGTTLVRRFEISLGWELTSFPEGRAALVARGSILVVAADPINRKDEQLLAAIDLRDGRILWEVITVRTRAHSFVGEWLIVSTLQGISARRPETGELVAAWPQADDS